MVEKLTELWRVCDTKQLSNIFEAYMKSIGVKKHDSRRKNNCNTYMIDGKSTRWNRVECFYHKDSSDFFHENLLIVLRKKAGNYFIIQRQSERAFECDYSGISCYDENLLNEIMQEHKPLFDELLSLVS